MDSQQLINATDLLELVLSFQDISSDLLTDPMVPNYFLTVSADTPSAQYDFFTLCSLADQVRLTHMDIIEEELILALHIDIGFSVRYCHNGCGVLIMVPIHILLINVN